MLTELFLLLFYNKRQIQYSAHTEAYAAVKKLRFQHNSAVSQGCSHAIKAKIHNVIKLICHSFFHVYGEIYTINIQMLSVLYY